MSDDVASSGSSGFTVRLVGTVEENEVFTVGIAEDSDGMGRCLLFSIQTNQDWDPQDIAHEEDTYCIVDEVQSTTYGGVISCLLTPQELRLKFSDDAAYKLQLNKDCRFPLQVDEVSIKQLRDGLRRVLTAGRNYRAAPADLIL